MKLTVLSFNEEFCYWTCVDSNGEKHKLDLVTDSTFKEFADKAKSIPMYNNEAYEDLCKSILGKNIEVEETFPWVSFARNVKIID